VGDRHPNAAVHPADPVAVADGLPTCAGHHLTVVVAASWEESETRGRQPALSESQTSRTSQEVLEVVEWSTPLMLMLSSLQPAAGRPDDPVLVHRDRRRDHLRHGHLRGRLPDHRVRRRGTCP